MATAQKATEDKSQATAGGWLLILTMGPPITFYRAWVVSWLWFWFAVPFGVPVIGAVHMFGLLSLYKLAIFQPSSDKSPDNSTQAIFTAGMSTVLVTTIGLGVAYFAALHMGKVSP